MLSIHHTKRYLAASLLLCLLAKWTSSSTVWNYSLRDRFVAATAGLKYSQNNTVSTFITLSHLFWFKVRVITARFKITGILAVAYRGSQKSNLYYTRGIKPKRVTSGVAHLQGRWEGGPEGTFGTGPGIFRVPGILRMPRIKIGLQVWKGTGHSKLDEGRQSHPPPPHTGNTLPGSKCTV